MLSEMSSYEISEWMAFYSLEPWGWTPSLYGHAITTSMIANVNRKKGAKRFQPLDFIPHEKQREQATQRSFFEGLKDMLFRSNGNKPKRKKR